MAAIVNTFLYSGTLQQVEIPPGTQSIDVHLWGGAGGGGSGRYDGQDGGDGLTTTAGSAGPTGGAGGTNGNVRHHPMQSRCKQDHRLQRLEIVE